MRLEAPPATLPLGHGSLPWAPGAELRPPGSRSAALVCRRERELVSSPVLTPPRRAHLEARDAYVQRAARGVLHPRHTGVWPLADAFACAHACGLHHPRHACLLTTRPYPNPHRLPHRLPARHRTRAPTSTSPAWWRACDADVTRGSTAAESSVKYIKLDAREESGEWI